MTRISFIFIPAAYRSTKRSQSFLMSFQNLTTRLNAHPQNWQNSRIRFKAGMIPKFREGWPLENPMESVLSTRFTLAALAVVNVDDFPLVLFSHFW
jgi:hypothetical protein